MLGSQSIINNSQLNSHTYAYSVKPPEISVVQMTETARFFLRHVG